MTVKKKPPPIRYKVIEDTSSQPPTFRIVTGKGDVLVPAVPANADFPCGIHPETHELRYVTSRGASLPLDKLPSHAIEYLHPFDWIVRQGDYLFVLVRQYRGYAKSDKQRRYGFVSVNLTTGERRETGLIYACANLQGNKREGYFGVFQQTEEYCLTHFDTEICHLGGTGLLNERLEVLLTPEFDGIEVCQASGSHFAVVMRVVNDRRQYGLFNIDTREWIAPCQFDLIEQTSKYFLLIQGWLKYELAPEPNLPQSTQIIDHQGQPVSALGVAVFFDSSDEKSDPDVFLFMQASRWGRVHKDGTIVIQPQYEFGSDVPDKEYQLSDIKLSPKADARLVLDARDLALLTTTAQQAPLAFKYEGTELGPDGQAALSTINIENIACLVINPEYENFQFIVVLQAAPQIAPGTVLLKRLSSARLTILPASNTKLCNYLENILAQFEPF